jgi:hypothetical protein
MKLLVFRSVAGEGAPPPDDYSQEFDTRYAGRVLGNLRGGPGFCSSCGPDCTGCRALYARRFGEEIAGVVDLPAVLPHVLERPAELLPGDVPRADVILAIAVHEQLLLEIVRRAREWGARGVVAPLEAPGWISPAARAEALRLGEELGVEVALPKPFCDFRPPEGSFLSEFRRHFAIGRPEVKLEVRDGRIVEARVEVSAACGATYYVARWLAGRSVDDDLRYDVVSKRFHSYPCTASMEWDDELGETVLHVASEAHCAILEQIGVRGGAPRAFVSPSGVVLPEPPRGAQSARNIERAAELILEALAERGELRVGDLAGLVGVNPAAVSSALINLKRRGRVAVADGMVRPG